MNKNKLKRLLTWSLFLLLLSCESTKDVPFPENASGYIIPKAVPFTIPESVPISWQFIPEDSMPKPRTISFDVEQLPKKSFSIKDFRPLTAPITEIPFEWDALPEIPYELDSTIKFTNVRKMLLPEPSITLFNIPVKYPKSTSAMLQIAESEGLSGNVIISSIEDSTGNLWVTTDKGLIKFNGKEFYRYNILENPFITNTASPNFLTDLAFDDEGRLLVSSAENGIYRIDIEAYLVEFFVLPIGFSRFSLDENGIIWAGSYYNGLLRVDLDKRIVNRVITEINGEEFITSYGAWVDEQQRVWFGSGERIGIIDQSKEKIKYFGPEHGLNVMNAYGFAESEGVVWPSKFRFGALGISLLENKIYKLGVEQGFGSGTLDVLVSDNGDLWFNAVDSITLYKPKAGLMKKFYREDTRRGGPPAKGLIRRDGTVFIGSESNGFAIIDPSAMYAEHFSESSGLNDNDTWGMLEDLEGRIWMSTYNGIDIYDPEKQTLSHFDAPESLGSNVLPGMSKLRDDLYFIGALGGFALVDLKASTWTSYRLKRSVAGRAWRAETLPDGSLAISSTDGLLVFDRVNQTMKKVDKSTGLTENTVYISVLDKDNKLWICTSTGVDVLDLNANTVQHLNVQNGIKSLGPAQIIKTAGDEIIVGGTGGISIFSEDRSMVTHVTEENGLIPQVLYDMLMVNGELQIGSENGIILVERPKIADGKKPWRFTNYGKAEGYPYNDYNQATAIETTTGQVWWGASPIITVNLTLPLEDTLPDRVQILDISIMDRDFKDIIDPALASVITANDIVYPQDDTIGISGKQLLDQNNYFRENDIKWESFKEGTRMPLDLRLPYHQNSFVYSFVNTNIIGRDKVVYRYILEGHDDEWSEPSAISKSRIYYNILPGKYTFKVSTRGANGMWSAPATHSFTILAPWWQTWWALTLYIIILIALIYIIVQVRSYYLQKENRILEERVSHRTAQLKQTIDELKTTQSQLIQSEKMASLGELTAGIAHEIQNPLNFVNNFSDISNELIDEMNEEIDNMDIDEAKLIAADIKQNLGKISHHGKRAEDIVKSMLQHSRTGSGQKEPTDINALADEYLRLAYHGLRAKDKSFNADFQADLDPDLPSIQVVAQDIGRVLLNLINNAFHAVSERQRVSSGTQKVSLPAHNAEISKENDFKPFVQVRTRKIGKHVEILVSDNGFGIPEEIKQKIFQPFFTTKPTGEGTGLGLSMSYDIITNGHNGTLTVDSSAGQGSAFKILLPINDLSS